VVDPGLCHGAGGVGHLYHRLYRTRLCPCPSTRLRERGRETAVDQNDSSLITGAAGIGLALLLSDQPGGSRLGPDLPDGPSAADSRWSAERIPLGCLGAGGATLPG
jgi:hypothetical protein